MARHRRLIHAPLRALVLVRLLAHPSRPLPLAEVLRGRKMPNSPQPIAGVADYHRPPTGLEVFGTVQPDVEARLVVKSERHLLRGRLK